jgi:hypothetical protein
VFVPWHLQNTYKGNQHSEASKDAEESKFIETGVENEQKQAKVFHRYYHMFKEGELEALIAEISCLKVVDRFYDHANWVAICEKVEE